MLMRKSNLVDEIIMSCERNSIFNLNNFDSEKVYFKKLRKSFGTRLGVWLSEAPIV